MTTKIEDLSPAQVVEAVRKLASERPDFVYVNQPEREAFIKAYPQASGCSYVGAYIARDSAPGFETYKGEGCIVGQALASLGVSEEELIDHENIPARAVVSVCNSDDDVNARWLAVVQGAQDSGLDWAEAVARADKCQSVNNFGIEVN